MVCINQAYIINISIHVIRQCILDHNILTRYSINCDVQKPHILQAPTCIGTRILYNVDKIVVLIIFLWASLNYNVRRHTLSNTLWSHNKTLLSRMQALHHFSQFWYQSVFLHLLHAWFLDRDKIIWIGATNNSLFLLRQADTLHQLCCIKYCTERIWSLKIIDSFLNKLNDQLFHHLFTVVNEGIAPTIIRSFSLLDSSQCRSSNISRY